MSVLVPIGDFSRMTHLSVKALRFYHEQGLLEPARIDESSDYRYYDPGQVPPGAGRPRDGGRPGRLGLGHRCLQRALRPDRAGRPDGGRARR